MKTLYLLRHAKSSWDHPEVADFDRELNARGEQAAPRMAQVLEHLRPVPGFLLTSTARRALQTAERVRAHLSTPLTQHEEAGLYLASDATLLQHIQQVPASAQGLVVIAHNPGLADLIEALCFGQTFGHVALKTAGLAVLDVAADGWEQVFPGSATLRALLPSRLMHDLLS